MIQPVTATVYVESLDNPDVSTAVAGALGNPHIRRIPAAEHEPQDRDALIRERDQLMAEIRIIEVDLGQASTHTRSDGTEYTEEEREQWRRKARYARAKMMTRRTEIKRALQAMETPVSESEVLTMLRSITNTLAEHTKLLNEIAAGIFEPDEDEPVDP